MHIDPQSLPTTYDDIKRLCLGLINEVTHLNRDVEMRDELIRLLRLGRFGSKSEQMLHPGMRALFEDESEADTPNEKKGDGVPVTGHTRKPKARQPFPDSIPRENIRLDLAASDKHCGGCGNQDGLKTVTEQVSEKLHVKPAQYVVLRYLRPIYSCPKCEAMKAAPLPSHPIPKCSVTTETLSGIAVSKYLDSLPLYRQEQIFLRGGIDIGRDKMSRWMVQLGERLKPIILVLHKMLLSGSQMSMDETYTQVLKEDDRLATTKSFMIVQARGDPDGRSIVLFHYSPSRSREAMGSLMTGFRGNLLTDGLGVYDSFEMSFPGVVHSGCWAHVRRKYVEAQKGSKPSGRKGGLASYGVRLIDKLFAIEAETKHLEQVERLKIRFERSKPLIEELKVWLDEKASQVPKKSLIGQAISYTLNQWRKLIKFLDDGSIPIHNNFVENLIRPYAVGRRNWLFSDTPEGAEANAVLYSLLVTAKINGLNPTDYLTFALKGIVHAETEADVMELLPLRPLQ